MLSIYAPKNGWTPELRQEVCDLWDTMTATEIAGVLNGRGYTFSRNAIIGTVHRAGKSVANKTSVHPSTPNSVDARPRTAINTNEVNKARARAGKPVTAPEPFVCQDAADIVPRHLTLVQLEDGDCRYPYGDSDITFCGHPIKAGTSYCRPHCRVAFNGIPIPKRAGFIDLGKSSGGVFGRVA